MSNIKSILNISKKNKISSEKNLVSELDSEKSSEEKTNLGCIIKVKTSGYITLNRDSKKNTIKTAIKKNSSITWVSLRFSDSLLVRTGPGRETSSKRPLCMDTFSFFIPSL